MTAVLLALFLRVGTFAQRHVPIFSTASQTAQVNSVASIDDLVVAGHPIKRETVSLKKIFFQMIEFSQTPVLLSADLVTTKLNHLVTQIAPTPSRPPSA